MSENHSPKSAEFLLPCSDLDQSIEFYTNEVGFRLCTIFPADNPRSAVLEGFGLRFRLTLTNNAWTERISLRVFGIQSEPFVSPDGVTIEFVDEDSELEVPQPVIESIVNKNNNDWVSGRAGMTYRDLVPGRLGGYLIASQIHVPDPGPVSDYVHFHNIRFQLIYCLNGWAKLVYEDQGEPFLFEKGDCVLQPPMIRHRVLETSGSFDVVEVSCPAEHITHVEHNVKLPNEAINNERSFGEQKFHLSKSVNAQWLETELEGFEVRDLGLAKPANGTVDARILRYSGNNPPNRQSEQPSFVFIANGKTVVGLQSEEAELSKGDSLVVASGTELEFKRCSDELEMLEVRLIDKERNS